MGVGLDYCTIIDTTGIASGNVSYTNINYGGGTPNVVITFYNYDTTPNGGSPRNHLNIGVGAADDNGNEFAMTVNDEHGVTTTDTGGEHTTAATLMLDDPGAFTSRVTGAYNAMVTNGFQLSYAATPDEDYPFFALCLGGDALTNYQVGTFEAAQTVNTYVDVTTTGFTADLVLLFNVHTRTSDPDRVEGGLGMGACDKNLNQASFATTYNDGVTTSSTVQAWSETYALSFPDQGNIDSYIEVTALSSGSFRAYTRGVGRGAADDVVGYVALAFQNASTYVGKTTTPTSTGSRAETAIGFNSEFVLEILCMNSDVEHTSNYSAGAASIQIMDADGQEACCAWASEDGVTTTNSQSQFEHTAVHTDEDDGTSGYVATLTSIDATGLTRNWTTALAQALPLLQIAVEQDAGGTVPVDNRKVPRSISTPILRGVI